jgi:hypothetical protein
MMTTKTSQLTKEELKVYILIFCASVDSDATEDEMNLVKSKTTPDIFNKMLKAFSVHSEKESIDKIEESIHLHEFTEMELAEFRQEIYKLFLTDSKFHRKEQSLDRILDNILY